MKILIYNWTQFDNALMAGGGVTLYLRNVIEEMLRREDVEIYFLSAGADYGMLRRKPRIEPTSNAYDHPRLKTFRLINSPIKAPAHDAFYAVDAWLNDKDSSALFEGFLKEHGPFDAVHLHNLEGISANILTLPKGPHMRRLFYTFHNYMPVCPQIELLYDGREPCEDYHDGTRCLSCLGHQNQMRDLVAFARMGHFIKGRGIAGHPLGGFLFDVFSGTRSYYVAARNLFRDVVTGLRTRFRHWHLRPRQDSAVRNGWRPSSDTQTPTPFALEGTQLPAVAYRQWRESNGEALRDNVDGLFAVSELCRQTVLRFLPKGTEVETLTLPIDIEIPREERIALRANRDAEASDDKAVAGAQKPVTLSFIGYPIPSKGLPFLIDALTGIDDPFYRENVDLLIVARMNPMESRRLLQLESYFRSVRVIPSYARDQLTAISQMIDLNIVPSIWWETFNQVTVELARLGVPSLVSSHVGAKETLPHHDRFVFRSSDAEDLRQKLDRLVKDPALRDSFFDTELNMPSMRAHVDLLLDRYSGAGPKKKARTA